MADEKKNRWHRGTKRNEPSPAAVEAFLDDIDGVFRKHDLSLGHEDSHGGFIVEPFCEYNVEWVRAAALDEEVKLDGQPV